LEEGGGPGERTGGKRLRHKLEGSHPEGKGREAERTVGHGRERERSYCKK